MDSVGKVFAGQLLAYYPWCVLFEISGCLRGHLQTKIFTLNVIVTLKGGGGLWQMNMTLIFEISFARAQKDINSMQVQ